MQEKYQFNVLAFFVAFCFGIVYIQIKSPEERMIIKYPTPYNVNRLVYRGQANDCYMFKTEEVDCNDEYYEQPIV